MISISLPMPPTGLRAPGSPASTAPPGDFALALAVMLAVPDAGVEPTSVAIDRQIDAGPGKALPVGDGIDATDLNPNAADKDPAPAQPASDAVLPQPVTPLVPRALPVQGHLRSTAPSNAPIDSERSEGEERAHARKETIAALPLPIPAAVLPIAMPDAPPAPPMTDIAPSAASVSGTSTIAPVRSAVIASPEIATALPPGQPLTMHATPNVATNRIVAVSPSDQPVTMETSAETTTKAPAAASATTRLAPEMPRVESVARSIAPDELAGATGIAPVIAQPKRRPVAAQMNRSAPTAPRAAVDAIIPMSPATSPAEAPMRPTRFLARTTQAAETVVPDEQRPYARTATIVAKRTSDQPDAGSGDTALPSSRFPKPANAATASASPREASVIPASAMERITIATGVEKTGPRDTSGVTKRAAPPPLPAERHVVSREPLGRVKRPDAPRLEQTLTMANTTPAIDAVDGGTLRPRSLALGQIDIAAHDPRPEIKTVDSAMRPARAPITPQPGVPLQPGASIPHRTAAPDASAPAISASSVQSVAPAVTRPDPALVAIPVARPNTVPERADKSIAPAQPLAPALRPAPIAPPAAAPIAAMFDGPRPIGPRAPRAGEIGDAPAGLAHTLAATHAASPIQPVTDIQRTPLDMRRDDWTQKLIDRIETIRDAANAADTRIKLMPDALGKIDISMRKDGDTVHVAFTADVPATRAMLADAQPRLAELAQQRGLRLGQASVDAGTSGDGQQRSADPRPLSPRPMRASARAEAPTETGRVA